MHSVTSKTKYFTYVPSTSSTIEMSSVQNQLLNFAFL